MMPQLALAALLLSAVTLGYPTVDDIVPEAEVLVQSQVQLSSSVDTLRKQYHQLEVQLKGTSGLKVTPKVKETIQTMLQMVEDEIEPAITEAHTADQQVLEAKM